MADNGFRKISEQIEKIVPKYGSSLSIDELLDFSDIADNPIKLSKEIARQPAIHAYYQVMANSAKTQLKRFELIFDNFKASKIKVVIEILKSDGVKTPTAKLIDTKFLDYVGKTEYYLKLMDRILYWTKMVDDTAVIMDALNVREQAFRSISYMIDSMLKTGLLYPKKLEE